MRLINSHFLVKIFICAAIIILVVCAPARFEKSDSRYNLLPATSLIQHHTFYVDSYNIKNDFRIYETGAHSLYFFPIGTAIVTLPIIAVLELLGVDTFKHDIYVQRLVTSVCLICIFLVMIKLYTGTILIPCVFFFCTGVASTLCSALWSHDFAILFCLIAILKIKNKANFLIIGLYLFLSYLCRPTFSIFCICALSYLGLTNIKNALCVGLTLLLLLFIFSVFSQYYYCSLLPPYYMPSRLSNTNFWTALYGNLLSPSRGLLTFSPFLLFINWLKLNDKFSVIFGIVWPILHWVIASRFPIWWGGYSFGPRLMVDCLPGLYIAFCRGHTKPNLIFIAAIIFSFYINSYKARWDIDSALNWNKLYLRDTEEENKAVLFSWGNSQLLS